MHEIMELKENLMNELGEYARAPKLSVEDVMVVKALSSAIDHMCNIIMAAEEEEGMYYMRGGRGGNRYSREGGQGGNRYSREGGENRYSREGGNYRNSYAGRRGNVRRDSMGRYSRDRGYYRAAGMEELVEEINQMMDDLPQNIQQDAEMFVQKIQQEM